MRRAGGGQSGRLSPSWRLSEDPQDTSEHDGAHLSSEPDPPTADQVERRAPVDPEEARWEERAHEEADAAERSR